MAIRVSREPAATAGVSSAATRPLASRTGLAVAVTLGLLAIAWIGRAATSSDGAEMLSDTFGLLLSPGRGLVVFAPVAVLALLALRRVPAPARVLCGLVPLTLLLVSARWFSWHGASSWGPRLLLPALPLLAAPAVLLPRAVSRGAVAVGIGVNLLGVLVAPGAFISYAELLRGEATSTWPRAGADRVSTLPLLAPPLGHAVFLARGAGLAVPAPWLGRGTVEGMALPGPAAWLSPRLLRALGKLSAVEPISARLLARIAVTEAFRGRPAVAARFAREALALDPRQRADETLRVLAVDVGPAGGAPPGSGARPR